MLGMIAGAGLGHVVSSRLVSWHGSSTRQCLAHHGHRIDDSFARCAWVVRGYGIDRVRVSPEPIGTMTSTMCTWGLQPIGSYGVSISCKFISGGLGWAPGQIRQTFVRSPSEPRGIFFCRQCDWLGSFLAKRYADRVLDLWQRVFTS